MHPASERAFRNSFQGFLVAVLLTVAPSAMSAWKKGVSDECAAGVALSGVALLPTSAFSKMNNAFSWKVLNGLQVSEPDSNLHFGGLSATIALQMLQNGAEEETRIEIATLLGNRGQHMAELNGAARDLLQQFETGNTDEILRVANSLWTDDTQFSFYSNFASSMSDTFQALVKTVTFASPDTVPTINKWVSDRTEKMISKLLQSFRQTS